MSQSLAERMSVVETKVSTLQDMAAKVDDIHEYIITEKANRRLRNRIFASIAGLFAFVASVAEILRR